MVQISELVTVRKLKFCTGLRNLVLTENSLSVFKIFHFAAIMGLKTSFLVQKCRFRSLLKRPARLPTFDFQPQIWYTRSLVNYLKMTVTAFFSKNIFDNQPAADSRTSFEARNRLFGPGPKTETRPKKLKPLTDTGNLYGTT